MEKQFGYVVITEDGRFYKSAKRCTNDVDKAKDFTSYATAKKIAGKINGDVREIVPSYYRQ